MDIRGEELHLVLSGDVLSLHDGMFIISTINYTAEEIEEETEELGEKTKDTINGTGD